MWGENFKKIITSFIEFDWDKKKISIMWWEPLLNMEFLVELINFIAEVKEKYKNKDISFAPIPTNGTVYDKGFYELLRDNNVDLRFSVDYFFDKSDFNRLDLKDVSVDYKKSLKHLSFYKDTFGYFPWVRIVVTKSNVDYLLDLIKYFIYDVWIKEIHFWVSHWFDLDDEFYEKFIRQYKKIFDFYVDSISLWDEIAIEPIELIIVDCFRGAVKDNSIFNCRNQVCWMWREASVSFDGNIYSCDLIAWSDYINDDLKNEYLIWDVDTGIDFLKAKKDALRRRLSSFSKFWTNIWLNKKICYLFDSKTMKFDNMKNYVILYKANHYIFDYVIRNLKDIDSKWVWYLRDKYWLYWENKWVFKNED